MKNLGRIIVTFIICIFFTIPTLTYAQEDILTLTKNMGYDVDPKNTPKSSMVIDAENGDILWEHNIDLKRDPASISKLMVLFLMYEDIENGKLSLDTQITATANDEAIGKIFEISNNDKIFKGISYPIKELIPMILVPSSNVATIMVANYLSNNDVDAFLDRMNNRAQELGMTNTKFYNASGATARAFAGRYKPKRYDNYKGNVTTARDLSILTYHFLKKYDTVLQYTKDVNVKTMVGTPYEETFHSYNHSLKGADYELEGTDGLKTGSSPFAAFNIVMTTKQQNRRLITIVMGVGDWVDQKGEYYRHPFANAITKYAFDHYDRIKAFDTGKNKLGQYSFEIDNPIYITIKNGTPPTVTLDNGKLVLDNTLQSVVNATKVYSINQLQHISDKDDTEDFITNHIWILISFISIILICATTFLMLSFRKNKA